MGRHTGSYKMPYPLPDGSVTVKARVVNSLGLWSTWSVAGTMVSNTASESPIDMRIAEKRTHAVLSWVTDGTFDFFVILRDGLAIGRTDLNSYTDHLCVGKHTYIVRGMTGDNYTDSQPVVAIITPVDTVISKTSVMGWIHLPYRLGGPPVHTDSQTREVQFVHYAGHRDPVGYSSSAQTVEHQLSYTLKDRNTLKDLCELIGEEVILKDWRGDLVIGVLTGISRTYRTHSLDIDLTITRTDFDERVSYD